MATSTIKTNDKYVGNNFNDAQRTTFTNVLLSYGKTIDIPLLSGFRALMIMTTANSIDNGKGLYFLHCTNAGDVSYQAIKVANDVTITTATNKLTITNNTTVTLWINFLIMNGNISTVTVRT